jgi:hypothetical protein
MMNEQEAIAYMVQNPGKPLIGPDGVKYKVSKELRPGGEWLVFATFSATLGGVWLTTATIQVGDYREEKKKEDDISKALEILKEAQRILEAKCTR